MTLQDEIRLLLEAPMMNTHDVRTQLRLDHDELLQVARDMVEADGGDSRRMLLRRLRPELLIHLQAVQQEVYASLRKLKGSRTLQARVDERNADHQALMGILAWLAKSRKTEFDEWASRAESLFALLRQHVEAEQEEIFPMLGDHYDDAALEQMAQSFLAAKARLAALDTKTVVLQTAVANPVAAAPRASARMPRNGRVAVDGFVKGERSLRA